MWLWEVDCQIEADAIRLAYAWLGKAFGCWGEDNGDTRKLFLQGLLDIIVIGATAYTAVRHSDCLLKDLNGQECFDESQWRCAICHDQARLHSELVQRKLEVKERVDLDSGMHRCCDLREFTLLNWFHLNSIFGCYLIYGVDKGFIEYNIACLLVRGCSALLDLEWALWTQWWCYITLWTTYFNFEGLGQSQDFRSSYFPSFIALIPLP